MFSSHWPQSALPHVGGSGVGGTLAWRNSITQRLLQSRRPQPYFEALRGKRVLSSLPEEAKDEEESILHFTKTGDET